MSDPDSDDIYREALILAELAATEAAEFIQSHSGAVAVDLIHEKGLNDIVSFVDEGAQDIIVGLIRRAYPDHHILAEEGFNPAELEPRHREGYSWIVDPLDGTTNFMHGVPQYGISIALMLNGKAMMGLVYDVCRGESFSAIRGAGARFGDASCRVSRTSLLADSLIATGFPYKQFDYLDAYTECIRRFWQDSRGVRRPGAASLDLAWVACGRFEGFFEQGLMPWDVAAGALIVEEAGGRYSDFSDSDGAHLGSEIVASNQLIHDEMIERLIPLRTADAK